MNKVVELLHNLEISPILGADYKEAIASAIISIKALEEVEKALAALKASASIASQSQTVEETPETLESAPETPESESEAENKSQTAQTENLEKSSKSEEKSPELDGNFLLPEGFSIFNPNKENASAGNRWTEAEDNELIAQFNQRMSAIEIAKKHNRTPISIIMRLSEKHGLISKQISEFLQQQYYAKVRELKGAKPAAKTAKESSPTTPSEEGTSLPVHKANAEPAFFETDY